MKPKISIGIIVAVVAVVIFLTASFIAGPKTVPAEVRLDREIAKDVERAQRMLQSYDPAASRLLVERQLHQKGIPAAEQKSAPRSRPSDFDADSPLAKEMPRQARRLRELQNKADEIGGEAPSKARVVGSFHEFENTLEQNEQLLYKALQIVQRAIKKQVQSGDVIVRGNMHPEATRLEAVLIFHQADLLARKAEAYREAAHDERMRFYRTASQWEQTHTQAGSLNRSLVAGIPEKIKSKETQPPVEEPETSAAEEPAMQVEQQPQKQEAEPKREGKISNFLKKLTGGGKSGNQSPTQADPMQQMMEQPSQSPEPSANPDVQQVNEQQPASSETPMAEIVFEQFPTLDARLAELREKRDATEKQIKQMEQVCLQLRGITDQLAQKVENYETKAVDAEQRMMTLEEQGIDPSAPGSLQAFIEAYGEAFENHRQAWRDATLLEKGAIRNAKPDTEDENQLASAPLTAEDPSRKMEPVRGLDAYRHDLKAAEIVLENEKNLLNQIVAEIDRLIEHKAEVQKGVTQLQADSEQISAKARRHFVSVLELAVEADRLENHALALIEDQGFSAAGRAARAASKKASEISKFVRSENPQKNPNPDLTALANDRSLSGHADTLEGDLHYLKATILAQRITAHRRQAEMLGKAAKMMLPDARELLAEEAEKKELPEYLYSAKAARSLAEQTLTTALESAEKALGIFQEADQALDQLWTLHTSIGAVQHLLARLNTEEEVSKKHLAQAVEEYRRSIHGREDRIETRIYQQIIDTLKPELK